MKTYHPITNELIEVLNLLDKNVSVFSPEYHKKDMYIVFDNEQKPVLLLPELGKYNKNIHILLTKRPEKNTLDYDHNAFGIGRILIIKGHSSPIVRWFYQKVAPKKFDKEPIRSELDILNIENKYEKGKGIGTQLIKALEYNAFIKQSKEMFGVASDFTETMGIKFLKKFYTKKGYSVNEFNNNIKKELKQKKIKEYVKNILPINHNGYVVKVVVPEGLKQQIKTELKEYKNQNNMLETIL